MQNLPLFIFVIVADSGIGLNTNAVRVENSRSFGGPWLALQLIEQLKLDDFLNKQLLKGKEHIQWSISQQQYVDEHSGSFALISEL